MQSNGPVTRSWLRFTPIVILAIVAFFVWQLVIIQLRLSRNGAIARQLVESLQTRFPDVTFGGGASYESEIVYITVADPLDDSVRLEVEQWLRAYRDEQGISPAIWLTFYMDTDEDTVEIGSRLGDAGSPWWRAAA